MAEKKAKPDSQTKVGVPTPPDQAARDAIIRELDRNVLVEAAAGTGKTTSLVAHDPVDQARASARSTRWRR